MIAILSDIHDNIWQLEAVCQALQNHACQMMIFCGDFCAPFTLKQLAEGFEQPIHAVWGNNDGDKWLLTTLAMQAGNVTLHGEFAEIDHAGLRIGVSHYPLIGRRFAESGAYDLVCYGHNHEANVEQVGQTLLVNPGEVMGRFGQSTFAVYDPTTRTATLYDI